MKMEDDEFCCSTEVFFFGEGKEKRREQFEDITNRIHDILIERYPELKEKREKLEERMLFVLQTGLAVLIQALKVRNLKDEEFEVGEKINNIILKEDKANEN